MTSTCLLPVVLNVQERVALPEPVTLVGVNEQAEVLLVTRFTIPAKPSSPVIVIVDVPGLPLSALTLVGLAAMVKSWTVKVTVTEWERLLLVPVTITWNIPTAANVHDRVELPEPVRLVGLTAHDVLLVVRLTIPEKPFRAVTVIVEVAGAALSVVTAVGLAVML